MSFKSNRRVHLVELPQGGQNRLEVVKVESGADLEVRDFTQPDPFVDGAGADGETAPVDTATRSP